MTTASGRALTSAWRLYNALEEQRNSKTIDRMNPINIVMDVTSIKKEANNAKD